MKVSNSKLNVWDRCHFKYKLSYVDEWVSKTKSPALARGSMIHELIGMHDEGRSWAEIVEKIQEYARNGSEITEVSRVATLVERYVTDYAPTANIGWDFHSTERYLKIPLVTPGGNEYNLEGYIDGLVNLNGKTWLLERKTYGGSQWAWKPTQILMDSQTPLYCAALRSQGVEVYGIIFDLINTYEYKKPPDLDKLFQREKSYRTPGELDSILYQTGLAVDEILAHKGPYRKSLQRDCDFCPFQEPCLYDVKGVPIDSFLSTNFKKKEARPEPEEVQPDLVSVETGII